MEAIIGMWVVFMVVMVVIFIVNMVQWEKQRREMTPEERRAQDAKVAQVFKETGDKVNGIIEKWNDERREIRAAKRLRSNAFWGAVRKVVDRM